MTVINRACIISNKIDNKLGIPCIRVGSREPLFLREKSIAKNQEQTPLWTSLTASIFSPTQHRTATIYLIATTTMTLTSPSRGGKNAILKCPNCNCEHHAKTDVFGNRKLTSSNNSDEGSDFGVLELFGASAECAICLETCTDIVGLPCGHCLCKADYKRMGGIVRAFDDEHGTNRSECDDDVIVTVKRAGKKEVNGTYKKDYNRYTRSARYDGKDVEYSIEKRVIAGKKNWVICCRSMEDTEDVEKKKKTMKKDEKKKSGGNGSSSSSSGDDVVDFYRAVVNETCEYPSSVKWVASMIGMGQAPRSEVSYFGS